MELWSLVDVDPLLDHAMTAKFCLGKMNDTQAFISIWQIHTNTTSSNTFSESWGSKESHENCQLLNPPNTFSVFPRLFFLEVKDRPANVIPVYQPPGESDKFLWLNRCNFTRCDFEIAKIPSWSGGHGSKSSDRSTSWSFSKGTSGGQSNISSSNVGYHELPKANVKVAMTWNYIVRLSIFT